MKNLLSLILLIVVSSTGFGQDLYLIGTAGKVELTGNGSVSYSIGETILHTHNTPNNILTQGFQQSNILVTNIYDYNKEEFNVGVYPNPTNNSINLNTTITNYKLEILSVNGATVSTNSYNGIQKIDISNLVKGVYLFRFTDLSSNNIKLVKVVKQ